MASNLQLLLPIQLPTDNLQLASLSLDLAKSEQLVQNGHRLKNLTHRLWNTVHHHNEPLHPPTLSILFNSLLSNDPITTPKHSIRPQETTPRPGSPSDQPTQLQPPPQIFSIAPTPPIASSPINPPPSLIIPPQLPDQHPSTPCLLLSPQPNLQLADQSSSDCSSNHPSSTCFDSTDPNIPKHSRPLIDLRYSSDSTTPSSIGLKSFATSLSVEGRDDQPPHQDTKSPHHSKPSSSVHPPHRRATSTAGLKHKSRPISFVRLHSHTSSRSASPRLVQPIRETQHSTWSDEALHLPQDPSSKPVRSSLSHQQPPSSYRPISKPTAEVSSNQSNHHQSLDSLGSGTVPNDGYDSSASLPSLVSPIIPVTPNNSTVSAPFPAPETIIPNSLASSHATGISSSFLPSAPPPTPAENGAHLPTTMSAALIKSKPPQRISVPSPLPPATTAAGAGGKKKAKFFIKESEADDDRSPPLEPIQSTDARTSRVSTDINIRTPQLTPVASTIEPSVLLPNPNDRPPQGSGREGDELDGTDSDEWGSEYSDDEVDDESIDNSKYQEIEKKNEEEYYRQLFAKKHFDQRNRSQDGSEQPPPIRRAGLSMLFHPELNHLQHHPRSDKPVSSTVAPVRNQSALELRRQGSSSSRRPGENGSANAPTPHGPRLSLGLLPRPCSLIKSKSSVAVPVLAGHEPPAMVQRSPSSHDAQSSVTRQFQRPTPGGSNSIPNSTAPDVASQQQQPPTRSLPPPQQQQQQQPHHQRHPSRLGGKPENVEYSDDDSDSDEGGCNKEQETVQMTEEQERRLGRLVQKNTQNPATSSLSPPPATSNTEPIVLTTRPCRPQPIAAPLSPRTTRKNMYANELTESLRRNLIRERQMRAQAFGIILNDTNNNNNTNNLLVDDNEMMRGKKMDTRLDNHLGRGLKSSNNTLKKSAGSSSNSSTNHPSNANVVNREYRNFSKGFHRTGW